MACGTAIKFRNGFSPRAAFLAASDPVLGRVILNSFVKRSESLHLIEHRKQVSLYELSDISLSVPLFCKLFKLRGVFDLLGHLVKCSRARRAAEGNSTLESAGFLSQPVLAVLEQRIFGLTTKSTIVTEYLSGVDSVRSRLTKDRCPQSREQLLKSLAEEVARLHQMQVVHGDLQTDNILLVDEGFLFIDNERTRRLSVLSLIYRVRNLRQLVSKCSGWTVEERSLLLEQYAKAAELSPSATRALCARVLAVRTRSSTRYLHMPDRLSLEKGFWSLCNFLFVKIQLRPTKGRTRVRDA